MYHVDIVFCIDVTHSMHTHIERIKSAAIELPQQINMAFQEGGKTIDVLRVRVIAFRDYNVDSVPMKSTPFFILPAEHHAFESYISRLHAEGGQEVTSNHLDAPSSGLEALALAMQSNWTNEGTYRRRHIIIVWTDTTAHPLEKGGKPASYPTGMPKNFDELTDMWEGQQMQGNAKRLVLFARESSPWSDIGTNWEETVWYPSKAGEGLDEFDLYTIIRILTDYDLHL
jgi:hypothetical protein